MIYLKTFYQASDTPPAPLKSLIYSYVCYEKFFLKNNMFSGIFYFYFFIFLLEFFLKNNIYSYFVMFDSFPMFGCDHKNETKYFLLRKQNPK